MTTGGIYFTLKEVYIYFNNDAEALTVQNTTTLRGYMQEEKL